MRLFAGFGKRHVLIALAFSFVVECAHLSYAWLGGMEELRAELVAVWTLLYFLVTLMGLACAVAIDNLLGEAAGTAKRLILAMLAAAIATTVTVEALLYLWPAIEGQEHMVFLSTFHRIAYRFSLASGWAMLLIGLYTMLQASRRATERLHDTQLGALAAERNLVEADLRAMQARVEPDLLFAVLLAVDQAYARNLEAGERALDALIAFLRAALPAEPASSSTVAAELDLVRAYVGVVELLSGPKLELDIAAEPSARAQAIPAMLLLPLARWALDGAPAAALLQLGARRHNGVLELSVRSDLASATSTDGPDITGVRERLAHLYGARARLEASAEPRARRALIALPV